MTWECQNGNCKIETEYLIDMFDHYSKNHKSYPKGIPILCKEILVIQTTLERRE